MACSVFLPKPLSLAICPCSAACLRSSSERMESSLTKTATFLGPRPEIRNSSRTLAGIATRASASCGNSPVWTTAEFLRQILPDAGEFQEGALGIAGDIGNRFGQIADHPGGVAIGPHPKRICPLDLQDVGIFIEQPGHIEVLHEGLPPSLRFLRGSSPGGPVRKRPAYPARIAAARIGPLE